MITGCCLLLAASCLGIPHLLLLGTCLAHLLRRATGSLATWPCLCTPAACTGAGAPARRLLGDWDWGHPHPLSESNAARACQRQERGFLDPQLSVTSSKYVTSLTNSLLSPCSAKRPAAGNATLQQCRATLCALIFDLSMHSTERHIASQCNHGQP